MALEKGGELTISYLQVQVEFTSAVELKQFASWLSLADLQDEDVLKSTGVRQQKLQNWSGVSTF